MAEQGSVLLDALVERLSARIGFLETQLMMRDMLIEQQEARLDKLDARLNELTDATAEPAEGTA